MANLIAQESFAASEPEAIRNGMVALVLLASFFPPVYFVFVFQSV
jgi:hypothetical protein